MADFDHTILQNQGPAALPAGQEVDQQSVNPDSPRGKHPATLRSTFNGEANHVQFLKTLLAALFGGGFDTEQFGSKTVIKETAAGAHIGKMNTFYAGLNDQQKAAFADPVGPNFRWHQANDGKTSDITPAALQRIGTEDALHDRDVQNFEKMLSPDQRKQWGALKDDANKIAREKGWHYVPEAAESALDARRIQESEFAVNSSSADQSPSSIDASPGRSNSSGAPSLSQWQVDEPAGKLQWQMGSTTDKLTQSGVLSQAHADVQATSARLLAHPLAPIAPAMSAPAISTRLNTAPAV